MKFVRLAVVSVSLASAVCAQQSLVALSGGAGERFGSAAIDAGDVDGDGLHDVLVGVPGGGFGYGEVRCVSGRFLADGTGASVLWSATAGTQSGSAAGFGSSLAAVGDVTGDGVPDYAVGAPNLDYLPVGNDCGAVYVVNGATHLAFGFIHDTSANRHFGASLAAVRDVDGDGKNELAVGAPGIPNQLSGGVSVISGAALGTLSSGTLPAYSVTLGSNGGEAGFGTSVASGFDLDGDGMDDIAIGSPYATLSAGVTEGGAVWIMKATSPAPGTPALIFASYRSTIAGEHLGWSVDAKHDYNLDGVVDVVAGAPDRIGGVSAQVGRAVVANGLKLRSPGLAIPAEIYSLDPVSSNPSATTIHFGRCVRASTDLNGDGIGELLVGGPDYSQQFPSGPGRGEVLVFSGATGARIGTIVGSNNERLGDSLVGGFQDLDGDGFLDFAIAGSSADTPSTDCGKLKSVRLFPSAPGTYCTAKANSLGCTPAISWSGSASATLAAPFNITCANVLNQKTGFLTYSFAPAGTPFQGGFLCIATPVRRTQGQMSGGNTSGSDCSGNYTLDFNARIQAGIDPALVVGTECFAQYRARDPQGISGSSLSGGLRFLVNP
ncbi:MAG: FG-GAP repeat protein [Planctomycetes bacterium]|nr:FG-GAP repeat protein [Planctomycetota bacterium]